MRQSRFVRSLALFALAGLVAFAIGAPALASGAKSTSNEAEWIGFDPATNTVTAKILKAGKGPNRAKMKTGSQVTFNVIPEGSVLTRTSVAINGVRGELTDIPTGKTVLIYWVPDEKKEGEIFARKIDVVLSEAELDRRYGEAE
ncbi:MAG TPA: hypothetical protein VML54_14930 [Candidatus Limnocylindrales bacterium]|nr:hypothetical protein [Candidatus Limnocylindrales bacterium]